MTGLGYVYQALPHNAAMQSHYALHSPLQAQVVQWLTAPGATVRAGDVVLILEAMKMEHEVRAVLAAEAATS